MHASILSGRDPRGLSSPPAVPPRGRVYIDAGEVRPGDLVWDGSAEKWLYPTGLTGADVTAFLRVSRPAPHLPPEAAPAPVPPRAPAAKTLPKLPEARRRRAVRLPS